MAEPEIFCSHLSRRRVILKMVETSASPGQCCIWGRCEQRLDAGHSPVIHDQDRHA